ncbi:hypothetical protein FJW06_22930 [Mesorhizobium sp. B4-1-3]|uniref:hypothetical protein n=1 Tax=Mesorhizobium sp. B4-1-3 TaxID=2589889 RepID=UPI00112E3C9B|nr:hypothetical protein [Mesorhizobium sp. B4-1-3]TPI10432.1 hypothetical protein FJW06_22930 [Mesorhizobium sp. B4-1-3]
MIDPQRARIRLHVTIATRELQCEHVADALEQRYGKENVYFNSTTTALCAPASSSPWRAAPILSKVIRRSLKEPSL